MRINPQLNLVQTVETDAGRCYIHSTPISRQVFDSFALIVAKTYAMIMSEGLSTVAGPPVAKALLRSVAVAMGRWDGPGGVEQGLVQEVRRLTNVIMPTPSGYATVPYDQVLSQNVIDEDTLSDVEGALIFFTCASVMLRSPAQQWKFKALMGVTELAWGARITSSDATTFAASLPTLTPGETSPAPRASSIPH